MNEPLRYYVNASTTPFATKNARPERSRREQQSTDNQQPTTKNQKPETRNQKPETNNQKPTTNNQKPETTPPHTKATIYLLY